MRGVGTIRLLMGVASNLALTAAAVKNPPRIDGFTFHGKQRRKQKAPAMKMQRFGIPQHRGKRGISRKK